MLWDMVFTLDGQDSGRFQCLGTAGVGLGVLCQRYSSTFTLKHCGWLEQVLSKEYFTSVYTIQSTSVCYCKVFYEHASRNGC